MGHLTLRTTTKQQQASSTTIAVHIKRARVDALSPKVRNAHPLHTLLTLLLNTI